MLKRVSEREKTEPAPDADRPVWPSLLTSENSSEGKKDNHRLIKKLISNARPTESSIGRKGGDTLIKQRHY
ncbi:MAG: hypothetical protein ISS70_02335 [Phycisphaerae bacterium]|nr:hypothetical protein [Phycisphaerae bacterium]